MHRHDVAACRLIIQGSHVNHISTSILLLCVLLLHMHYLQWNHKKHVSRAHLHSTLQGDIVSEQMQRNKSPYAADGSCESSKNAVYESQLAYLYNKSNPLLLFVTIQGTQWQAQQYYVVVGWCGSVHHVVLSSLNTIVEISNYYDDHRNQNPVIGEIYWLPSIGWALNRFVQLVS